MTEVKVVDARGLSCPQPVLLSSQAIRDLSSGVVEVLVDSATSRDNVTRMARRAGWDVKVEEQASGGFKLILSK